MRIHTCVDTHKLPHPSHPGVGVWVCGTLGMCVCAICVRARSFVCMSVRTVRICLKVRGILMKLGAVICK